METQLLSRKKMLGTVGYLGGIMSVPEPFCWNWGQMIQFNSEALCGPGESIWYERSRFSLHDHARNFLVNNTLGDWLFQLDTDMDFDPDVVARMVRTMYRYDVDVLTGVYVYKKPPCLPVMNLWDEETQAHIQIGDWDQDSKLFEIGSAGGGCLLVRRQVFERIQKELNVDPFDRVAGKPTVESALEDYKAGKITAEQVTKVVRMNKWGEDYSFFAHCRELGIRSWCAQLVRLGHFAYRPVTLEDTRTDWVHTLPGQVQALQAQGGANA